MDSIGITFSYRGLRDMLIELKSRYAVFPLREWKGQPGVILRHDIDLDLEPALKMAVLENEIGAHATFFVMTTAESYNPASPRNRKRLRSIVELGGKIGLHFDPSLYTGADNEELSRAAKNEAEILEAILGREVCSISLHNPSVSGQFPLFEGWRNAYDPLIFSPDRYLSDSRMTFRADPREFLREASGRTFQLLLHPMHYSDDGEEYPAPMIETARRHCEALAQDFGVNSSFRHSVGGNFLAHVARSAQAWPDLPE
jgi:hypothetical protein